MTERMGDPLEGEDPREVPPPTNPGKPTEGARLSERRKFFLFIAAVVVFAVAFVLLLVSVAGDRPTPDEFCAGHGGVRHLDAGGFYTPAAATCRDGHAGTVYP